MSIVEQDDVQPSDLIVVGSSAGGVEALSVLVSTLPANFPAPLVLAQHLDPNRPSSLDIILQKRTSLIVEVVQADTKLQAGRIYVVPSNRHISINDHHVQLLDDKMKRPRPSVDTLLSSAAEFYGDHLIAVILTGSGTDGAIGAVDVKNAGGTVIIQDPQTARYPSMPLAVPPTIIDFEVNLEHIGSLLYELLNGVNLPQTEELTEDILRDILEQVSRQASIDFRPYKTSTILRRIGRRMVVTHNGTIRDYADYLKGHPEEVGDLVKAFLINVTQFFRDAEAFAYLRSDVLPVLIARARQRDHILRLWTAGCATGEEPYSLAMLLSDLLGTELSKWSIKIFATDLDESAITFARHGLYSENLLKGVSYEYRDRFFERVDHGYRISKTLRQMVIFGQQDLSHSAPFPRIDLVLCRNVLIYFTPELQDYVLNQFAFSLNPSGFLFLGKAETVRPAQSFYELMSKQCKVYRCVGNAMPLTSRQGLPEITTSYLERSPMSRSNRSLGRTHSEQEVQPPSLELGQLRHFNELLLRFLPIGVVIIDRTYHILTVNSSARRLLGLHDVGIDQDFLHAVHGIPYYDMRSAIDAVFHDRNFITLPEVELEASSGGNGRFISLSIALMQLEQGLPDFATISVADVTEQVQIRRQLESVQVEQTQLMQELGTANKRLSDMNKELMDANEELQVANEELMLTHEELQASIEEFETTNEELQATNEELETNNEELQATNEELETTNDELRARTGELQEMTTTLENDRVRLSEMVELAPFYILVLRGPTLLVEAYNPRYARVLEAREVQGHPLEEVIDLFWEPGVGLALTHLTREVYKQETLRTLPRMHTTIPGTHQETLEQQRGGYFSYTVVPTHNTSGRVDGVIVYAIDETEQQARELQEEINQLKTIFDNTRTAALALYDAQAQALVMGSPRYLELVAQAHNRTQDDIIGHSWQETTLLMPDDDAMQQWKNVLENRTPFRLPELTAAFAPDKPETVWDYDLTPITDTEEPDAIRYVLVSAVEITEQVHARKELEQLEQLRDDFLSLATHELRSPLTTIKANTQLLQRTLKRHIASFGQEQTHEQHLGQGLTQIDRILHQLTNMNHLITELMDVTRLQGAVFELHSQENVDLVALVRSVVEQQAPHKHSISVRSNEESILVTLDKNRIEQVLNNLLSNAIKYSPTETSIEATIEQQQDSHEVVVAIRDEGDGIQEEAQSHIFERFYRVRTNGNGHVDGLGLGLYIAYGIVKQHGGRMWLQSHPGDGSTFAFALPVLL